MTRVTRDDTPHSPYPTPKIDRPLPPIETDKLVQLRDVERAIDPSAETQTITPLDAIEPALLMRRPGPGHNCWLRKDFPCTLSLGCYTLKTLHERFHLQPGERILIRINGENAPGHRPIDPNEEIYIHDDTIVSILVERTGEWQA